MPSPSASTVGVDTSATALTPLIGVTAWPVKLAASLPAASRSVLFVPVVGLV